MTPNTQAAEQTLRAAEDRYVAALRAHAEAARAHHAALRADRAVLARGESQTPEDARACAAAVIATVDADDECRHADRWLRECRIAYLRSLS